MKYGFKDIVIDSRTGLNPRKNFVLGNGENNYITIKDIYNGQINITDKTDKVDDEAIKIIKKRSRIKVGDILFVSIGRIGETAIVEAKDDTWDVNESVFVFTINREIITPEYFCLLFQSDAVQKFLAGNSSGSTFKSIKMNQLERMEFDLPPLDVQKNITSKLSKIKAICVQRSSELMYLDELIKARFVEMFGDLRSNPKGWPVYCFEDITEIITDGEHATPRRVDQGIYLLSARNVLNHALQLDDVDFIDQDEYDRIAKRIVPQAGDVLISCSGSVGRCCTVPEGLKFQMVRSAALLRFDKRVLPVYAEYMITSDDLQDQISSSKTASSQANLFQGKIAKLKGFVPPLAQQEQFAAFVTQIDKSKSVIQKSLEETQLLFDSLTQKYFG